jgi:hypothetical protein
MYLSVVEFSCPCPSAYSSAEVFDKTHKIGEVVNKNGIEYILFDRDDGWRTGYRLDHIAEMISDVCFKFQGFDISARVSKFAKINQTEEEQTEVTYVYRKSEYPTLTRFLMGE